MEHGGRFSPGEASGTFLVNLQDAALNLQQNSTEYKQGAQAILHCKRELMPVKARQAKIQGQQSMCLQISGTSNKQNTCQYGEDDWTEPRRHTSQRQLWH